MMVLELKNQTERFWRRYRINGSVFYCGLREQYIFSELNH